MTNESEPRRLIEEMVSGEDEKIVLSEASLLIAKEVEYPNLDISKYMQKINLIADEIKMRMKQMTDPRLIINEINDYLFTVERFSGNEENYYDPLNSFLNKVLDRKTGIPITLSVLYMEVGLRLGLPMFGVGFPGHFIVRYSGSSGEILIDPFNRGRFLSESDCQEILNRIYRGSVRLNCDLLKPVSRKEILTRMLRNLKNIYLNSRNYIKALSVVDLVLLIDSRDINELKDRGLIHYALECFAQALFDLEAYLERSPNAADREVIKGHVLILRDLVGKIN